MSDKFGEGPAVPERLRNTALNEDGCLLGSWPCSLLEDYRRFRCVCCLHYQPVSIRVHLSLCEAVQCPLCTSWFYRDVMSRPFLRIKPHLLAPCRFNLRGGATLSLGIVADWSISWFYLSLQNSALNGPWSLRPRSWLLIIYYYLSIFHFTLHNLCNWNSVV
jgi:hypothetical protein